MSSNALVGIALGTLVSEDLATVAAGGLVLDGQTTLIGATAACVTGVYVGDLGLWLAGRVLGPRVLAAPWVRRHLDAAAVGRFSDALDSRLGAVVLASRFLPGTRLPLYVAAGICGRRPLAFGAWSLLAVLIWTPLLLWISLRLGASVAHLLVGRVGSAWTQAASAVAVLVALRWAARVTVQTWKKTLA